MQSGVGMLLPSHEPRMSRDALRIVRCAAHIRMLMQHPEATPWFEQHIFEVETALRAYAVEYISLASQDLDAQAELSKAIAAGRASRFSTAFAKGGFCQAGVVAPPDSLMGEKTAANSPRSFEGASH
jgi:hypothetical protein